MTRTILGISISILPFLSIAQHHEWSFSVGDSQFEHGNGIALDPQGNVYICGEFREDPDFDPDTSTAIVSENGGNGDIYVAKYNNAGEYLWAFPLGIYGHDEATDIEVDSQGNVYVTGYYEWDVDFDPGPDTAMLYSISWRDLFVAKYDTDGNHLWSFSLAPGGNVDRWSGLTLDPDDNLIVTGYYQGFADFDPGPGNAQLISAGAGDIFLAKYDENGNYIWANSIGGPDFDWGKEVTTDNIGNIYITGLFQSTINLNGGSSAILTANGGSDVLFAKYDGDGNYIWSHGFGSASTSSDDWDESGTAIAVDQFNNVYLTGYASGGDADPGPGTAQIGGGGQSDPFFAKYDSAGNLQWANNISDLGEGKGRGIAVDQNGNVYITGYLGSSFDLDFGPGINVLTGWDIFIAKYNTNGNHIWAFDAGDSAYDSGFDVAVDDSMNVYTTGVFYGIIDMDPDTGTAELDNVGGRDVFVSKHSPCYRANSTVVLCNGPYTFPDGSSSDVSTIHVSTWVTPSGCDSVIITDLTVVEIDTTISTFGNTLQSNESNGSYQWLDCDNGNMPIMGETGPTFTPAVNGNFAVEITVNGCTKTSNCIFMSSVGINEISELRLTLHPNPADNTLNVTGNLSMIEEFRILDISARTLTNKKVERTIDISRISAGSYVLLARYKEGKTIGLPFFKQ